MGGLSLEGQVSMSRRYARKYVLFCARHFTTCPVVLEGLECARANALVYPLKMKDDLSLLTSILAIQILARLLMRIDWDVVRGDGRCSGEDIPRM